MSTTKKKRFSFTRATSLNRRGVATQIPSSKYAYGSNLDIVWEHDPKLLGIRLARYKFAARMLQGMKAVVEVGCGDGWLSRVVQQSVEVLTLSDANTEEFIKWDPVGGRFKYGSGARLFDGAYALDVLEHVPALDEDAFLTGIKESLKPYGTLIIGMPSLESQPYASAKSKEGHINCKTESGLRELLERHFRCVYIFGMNDEVVHTGFGPLCHYRLAVCNSKL